MASNLNNVVLDVNQSHALESRNNLLFSVMRLSSLVKARARSPLAALAQAYKPQIVPCDFEM
jgi:hypothetical protein